MVGVCWDVLVVIGTLPVKFSTRNCCPPSLLSTVLQQRKLTLSFFNTSLLFCLKIKCNTVLWDKVSLWLSNWPGVYYPDHVGLEVVWSSCCVLLSAGIIGMYQRTQLIWCKLSWYFLNCPVVNWGQMFWSKRLLCVSLLWVIMLCVTNRYI